MSLYKKIKKGIKTIKEITMESNKDEPAKAQDTRKNSEKENDTSIKGNKTGNIHGITEQEKKTIKSAESKGQQAHLAEKLMLEQSIARLVSGKTGLLMLLDMLLHDAEEKDLAGFLFDAEGYLEKAARLKPRLVDYEKLAPEEPRLVRYKKLLRIGEELEQMGKDLPEGQLSEKKLDTWKENVLRNIALYNDQSSPVGNQR